MNFSLSALLMILSCLCSALCMAFVRKRLHVHSTTSISIIMSLMIVWALIDASALLSHSSQTHMVLGRLGYIAYAFLPIAWFRFMLEFVTHKKQGRNPLVITLFALSGVFVLLNWLNPGNLFYAGMEYAVQENGQKLMLFYYGPIFYIYLVYIYGVMLTVAGWLIYKGWTGVIRKAHALVMLAAVFAPLVGNILYILKFLPMDIAPILFILSDLLLLLLYKEAFFHEMPLSRSNIIDALSDGVVLFNHHGELVDINKAAKRMLCLESSASLNADIHAILGKWDCLQTPHEEIRSIQTFRHPEKGNRYYRVGVSLPEGVDRDLRYTILTMQDETALYLAEERIRLLEEYDDITGLYSQRHFIQHLDETLPKCQAGQSALLLACFSIIGYGNYCAVYGRSFGESLLRYVGQRINWTLRQTDAISRFSDDKFYLYILYGEQDSGVERLTQKMARRMNNLFDDVFTLEGITVLVRLQMGAAIAPYHAKSAETLLAQAELAMMNASTTSQHCCEYDSDMVIKQARSLLIRQQLFTALANNEFSLVYHPQVDAYTRRVVGVETLIRWNNPSLGFVPPDEFISVAEETGHICAIGKWVLRTAMRQLAKWHRMGFSFLRLGINVSLNQLHEQDFADTVLQLLEETGVNPACLELEVTESIALFPEALTQEQLPRLREHGVRIAMDDFGMGHSSLSYIKHFNLDTLKIDRVLSHDMLQNAMSVSMIRSVQSLCAELGMDIVVEYVEEEAQVALLRELGCHIIQGYVFSPPLRAEDCTVFIFEHLDARPLVATS